MKNERSYSAKSILIALGKSALYLLFFLAVQFFVVVIYGIVVAANAAINGETDLVRGAQTVANQLLGRVSALTLIACLLTVAVLQGRRLAASSSGLFRSQNHDSSTATVSRHAISVSADTRPRS